MRHNPHSRRLHACLTEPKVRQAGAVAAAAEYHSAAAKYRLQALVASFKLIMRSIPVWLPRLLLNLRGTACHVRASETPLRLNAWKLSAAALQHCSLVAKA